MYSYIRIDGASENEKNCRGSPETVAVGSRGGGGGGTVYVSYGRVKVHRKTGAEVGCVWTWAQEEEEKKNEEEEEVCSMKNRFETLTPPSTNHSTTTPTGLDRREPRAGGGV